MEENGSLGYSEALEMPERIRYLENKGPDQMHLHGP